MMTAAGVPETRDTDGLRIVSWNVAGWETALAAIRKRHGSLARWLAQHNIDILCLQETKTTRQVVEYEGTKRLDANVAGYDTFWCCNEGKAAQRKGLNGVATFCKKGLTVSASSEPLGAQEFDGEGRCILTDHGAFVVINVYLPYNDVDAPNASERLIFKVRYMQALKALIAKEQAQGKQVVFLGDMNVAPTAADRHWKFRLIRARAHFPKVLEAMQLPEVVVPAAGVLEDGSTRLLWRAEGMLTYNGYFDAVRRHLPPEDLEVWQAVAEEEGISATAVCVRDAYAAIAAGCGLVDPTRALLDAAGTAWYTCWNQMTNKRYVNEGSRIDHILVDARLWDTHGIPGALPTPGTPLDYVTAFGDFVGVPFSGGGLPEVHAAAYDRQFATPRTSPFLFTPPHYSDHIAVALLLRRDVIPTPLTLKTSKAVKACQPHAQQRSIASFFTKKPRQPVAAAAEPKTTSATTLKRTMDTAAPELNGNGNGTSGEKRVKRDKGRPSA